MPRYILYPIFFIYGFFVLIGAFGYYSIFLKPVFAPDKPKEDPYADISREGQNYGNGSYEAEAEARIEGLERGLSKVRNHGLRTHSLTKEVGLRSSGIFVDGSRIEPRMLLQNLDALAETEYVMVEIKVAPDVPMRELNALTQSLSDNGFDFLIDFG